MKKLILLFTAMLLFGQITYSQSFTARGVVVDQYGDPMWVIPVYEIYNGVPTGNATAVGIDGSFSLSVHPGSYIILSFVGYITKVVGPIYYNNADLGVIVMEEDFGESSLQSQDNKEADQD